MGASIFDDFPNELEGLERQIEKTNYYLSKPVFKLFSKNYNLCFNICLRLYFHHPFKTRKAYLKLKSLYLRKKKGNVSVSNGERIFFVFPYLYCVLYRLKRFFTD